MNHCRRHKSRQYWICTAPHHNDRARCKHYQSSKKQNKIDCLSFGGHIINRCDSTSAINEAMHPTVEVNYGT